MSDDEISWNIDDYKPTEEEDTELFLRVMRNYFPSPGNFHCLKDVDVFFERQRKADERYFKQHNLKWEDAYGNADSSDEETEQRMDTETDDTIVATVPTVTTSSTPVSTLKSLKENAKVTNRKSRGGSTNARKKIPDESDLGEKTVDNAEDVGGRPKVPDDEKAWVPYGQHYGNLRSIFTVKEHERFVGMHCSLHGEGKLRFQTNAADYTKMTQRLTMETVKFEEFVKQSVSVGNKLVNANNALPRWTREYVTNCMKHKLKVVVSALPKRYFTKGIHYVTMPMQDPPKLEFSKQLLEVGKPAPVSQPNMTRKATVPLDNVKRIEKAYPAEEIGMKPLIANDPNILGLVERYCPDFAVSSSALKCLIMWRGPMFSGECKLPVVVSPYYQGGRRQNVVYISKPLPPHGLSKRQAMARMAKYALKTQVVNKNFDIAKARAYSSRSSGGTTTTTGALSQRSDVGYYDRDAMGEYAPSTSRFSPPSSNTPIGGGTAVPSDINSGADEGDSASLSQSPNSSFDADDGDSNATGARYPLRGRRFGRAMTDTEDLDETSQRSRVRRRSMSISKSPRASVSFGEVPPVASSSPRPVPQTANDVVGGILSRMSSTLPAKRSALSSSIVVGRRYAPVEDPSVYVAPEKTGCAKQYSMFNLKDLQILVRSNVDGMVGDDTPCPSRVSISSKVEYLPMFGAEKQPDEEIAQEWLTAFLKQSDLHFRGRIRYNAPYDMLAWEKLKLRELPPVTLEGIASYLIEIGMRRLHVVLQELKKLENGSYMLTFNAKNACEFKIYQAPDEDGFENSAEPGIDSIDLTNLDLTTAYENMASVTSFEDCWRGLDPKVVLQWHRITKRIPTTFPPRQEDEKPNLEDTKKKKKPKRKQKTRRRSSRQGKQQQESEENEEGEPETNEDEEEDE